MKTKHSPTDQVVIVTSVEVLHEHVVRLGFSDGCVGDVDLGPELWGPVFEPIAGDYDLFRRPRDHRVAQRSRPRTGSPPRPGRPRVQPPVEVALERQARRSAVADAQVGRLSVRRRGASATPAAAVMPTRPRGRSGRGPRGGRAGGKATAGGHPPACLAPRLGSVLEVACSGPYRSLPGEPPDAAPKCDPSQTSVGLGADDPSHRDSPSQRSAC